jgi:hypothetical protein
MRFVILPTPQKVPAVFYLNHSADKSGGRYQGL